MTFLSRILRFLFWLLVVSWGVRLVRRVVDERLRCPRQARDPRHREVPGQDRGQAVGITGRLVRDPVCSTHVAEAAAIPLWDGAEVRHFCSIACRDKYMGNALRFAANS
jgi:hypothetical protein